MADRLECSLAVRAVPLSLDSVAHFTNNLPLLLPSASASRRVASFHVAVGLSRLTAKWRAVDTRSPLESPLCIYAIECER